MRTSALLCLAGLSFVPGPLALAADAAAVSGPAPKAAPAAAAVSKAPPALTAEAKALSTAAANDYRELVNKVNTKQRELTDAGQSPTEESFKDVLAQFDTTLQKYRDLKTSEVAQILFMKGMLYNQILRQQEKARPIFEQVQRDYPGTREVERAKAAIAGLARVAEVQKAQTAQATARATVEDQAIAALPEPVRPIYRKVDAKVTAGKRTEADLAPEVAEIDALLAARAADKSDATADILLFKASVVGIYSQEQALEIVRNVATSFPGPAGTKAREQVTRIETGIAAEKIRRTLVVGSVFPDFQVMDTAGKPLSVSEYRGRIVLVDFWAMWCGPCLAELPNVVKTYNTYHAQGLEIIGISLDLEEDRNRLGVFAIANKMPWRQYFDGKHWQNALALKYGVNSIPATYLLDREGRIAAIGPRGPALEAEVKKLLARP